MISDFGLASWDHNKAARFERCGTPGYIAPEVLNSGQGKVILDHRSDIFSLGVLAHILYISTKSDFYRDPYFLTTGMSTIC